MTCPARVFVKVNESEGWFVGCVRDNGHDGSHEIHVPWLVEQEES